MRKVFDVNMTEEYKEEVIEIINDNIDLINDKYNLNLDIKDKRRIKNLSLDQINRNISFRAKLKNIWSFSTEKSIPVIVRGDKGLSKNRKCNAFLMKSNLSWTCNEANKSKGGITEAEFEEQVLKMFKEDAETASFYGALSYVESDRYGR